MSMCITWFLQNYSQENYLGAKTSQWRPEHVPYLPYPRYATVRLKSYTLLIYTYMQ